MNIRQKKKLKSGLYYGISCWFDDSRKVLFCDAYVSLSEVKKEQRRELKEDGYFSDATFVQFPTKQPYWKHNNSGIHIAKKYIQNIKIGD